MSSYLDDLIKSAEVALARGDLDTAESLVGSALRQAKQAKNNSDDDAEDDWSEHADSEADGNNASLDDDDGDDDDDEDDDTVDKALRDLRKVSDFAERYVHDHQNMTAQVGSRHRPETYSTGTTPTAASAPRHKFHALIEHVADRDGVSKTVAQQRARVEFPRVYQSFQESLSQQPTSTQQMARGRNLVGKGAASSWESLVAAEMAKGCNSVVAGQRILQRYGARALDTRMFGKAAESISKRFQREVEKAADEEGCGLDEATRIIRKSRPDLYLALQAT